MYSNSQVRPTSRLRSLVVVLIGIVGILMTLALPVSAGTGPVGSTRRAPIIYSVCDVHGGGLCYGMTAGVSGDLLRAQSGSGWTFWYQKLPGTYGGFNQYKIHVNGYSLCVQALNLSQIIVTSDCGASGTDWFLNPMTAGFLTGNDKLSNQFGLVYVSDNDTQNDPYNLAPQGTGGAYQLEHIFCRANCP